METKTWNLKTENEEATLQTTLESYAIHRDHFDDAMRASKNIEDVFSSCEVMFGEQVSKALLKLSKVHEGTLENADEVGRKISGIAMELAGIAGLAMCISRSYLKLLGMLAEDDEDATLECSVMAYSDAIKEGITKDPESTVTNLDGINSDSKPN